MEQLLHLGRSEASAAIVRFCCGKKHVALVTDGAAYGLCGAKRFFDDLFTTNSALLNVSVKRLVVNCANPKTSVVQQLLDEIKDEVDGFVAVGGGTTIDTAKLLNLALVTGESIRSLLIKKDAPILLKPCLAIPTTAGTGAEATRFAVCYDGETKFSIDFPCIRPSEVALIPEFVETLPAYQRLSTNFDAYAQAVESLWARGATEESISYANKALEFMAKAACAESSQESSLCQIQGSYWAGRAIDISRTTAAHAFSYFLTSHYGIPHGHAVYMVFEFICRNNGRPDLIKVIPGLKTLREFAAENGKEWDEIVEELFSHVNLKRLGNNPVEVKKEAFYV